MEQQNRVPFGLRVIRTLSILSVVALVITLGTLFFAQGPEFSFLSSLISPEGLIYPIFSLVFSVLLIVAINKRAGKWHKLLAWLFVIDLVYSAAMPIVFKAFQISPIADVLLFLATLFALWYWVKIKAFFFDPNFNPDDVFVKKMDNKAKWVLVAVIVLGLVSIFVSSNQEILERSAQIQKSSELLLSLKNKTWEEKVAHCTTLPQEDKEMCLILIMAEDKKSGSGQVTNDMCSNFSSEAGKINCYALTNQCGLLKEDVAQRVCEAAANDFIRLN